MAGLIRLGVVRALGRSSGIGRTPLRRNLKTSSKKTSVTTTEESCSTENKSWVSYGFNNADPFLDRLSMHITAFMSISFTLVLYGFFIAFVPDPKLFEWSQREAYLELRRRESLGLLPIDPDYIDPSKITLPTDEELGDTEIII